MSNIHGNQGWPTQNGVTRTASSSISFERQNGIRLNGGKIRIEPLPRYAELLHSPSLGLWEPAEEAGELLVPIKHEKVHLDCLLEANAQERLGESFQSPVETRRLDSASTRELRKPRTKIVPR